MAVRVWVRVLFGVAFTLVALPAVITLAGQLSAEDQTGTTVTGLVVQEHGDDFAADTARKYLTLVTDKDRFSLTGPGLAALKPGLRVSVSGRRTGGTIYLASTTSVTPQTNDKLSAAESAMVTGISVTAPAQARKVAVLLINFAAPTPRPTPSPTPCVTPAPTDTPAAARPTDSPPPTSPSPTPFTCPPPTPTPTPSPTPVPPPQPWSTAQVAGYYFNNTKSVASFYREVSNGSLTVTGDVFGWYTLTVSTSTCDYNGFATAARAAATAAGVDLTQYTNIAYAFPKVSACGWGGMGNVNGPYSWINGTSAMGVFVPTHELGHNFGSHHASSLTCTNSSGVRVQYSNNCTASEYGDPFDVMGSNGSSSGGIHAQNTWARRQIGVLTAADQQTVTATGYYFVATAGVDGGTPRILRVLRPSGDYLYLEFRQPYGTLFENWATTAPAVNGVMIRIAPNTARVQSKLIDAHPETSTFADAPLGAGEKFVDKPDAITIITKSFDETGANVYVQIGPDATAPTAPGSLTGTWTGATEVSLTWAASADEIGVTAYDIRRDGTLVATVGAQTLAWSDLTAPAGTKWYTVTARDAAGNASKAASVYVGPPDTTPPGAPSDLAATAMAVGEAQLSWSAATDDNGVASYDVSVDGTVVATVDALAYTVSGLSSLQSSDFAVEARDAAGNVGQATDTTFVMPDLVAPGSAADLVVSAVGKTSASLSWSAASDDVGVVGYAVSRDGVQLTTVTSTTFDDAALSPDTAYTYMVTPVDAAGNAGPSITVGVTTIEATPPTVASPVTAAASAGQVDTSAFPIVVSWSAADTSGVVLDELQQSKNGGAWTSVALPEPTSTSATLVRTAGNTYRFRVRATDSVANTSAWLTGATIKLIARQETSTYIKYVGTWTPVIITTASGGTLTYAKSSSASATLTFTGRSVAWIAPRASNRGQADVYVDGVYATTVDLYAASLTPRSIVFSRSWAASATHTLTIKVKATLSRPRVDVDAFVVLA